MPPKRRKKQSAKGKRGRKPKNTSICHIKKLPDDLILRIIHLEPTLAYASRAFNRIAKSHLCQVFASPPDLRKDTMTYDFRHLHNGKFADLIHAMNLMKMDAGQKVMVREIALSLREDYYFIGLQYLLNCFSYTPTLALYEVTPQKLRYLSSRGVEDLTIYPTAPHNYLFWLPYRFPNVKRLQLHFTLPFVASAMLNAGADNQSSTVSESFDHWLIGFNASSHKALESIVLLGCRLCTSADYRPPWGRIPEHVLNQARVYIKDRDKLVLITDNKAKARKLAEVYGWPQDTYSVCRKLRDCCAVGFGDSGAIQPA